MSHQDILTKAKGLNILILGDVMIDRYLSGKVNRISPEAPVPVVSLGHRDDRLGGAGNVALNIAALGANPILCSVVGDDENGKKLLDLLAQRQLSTPGIQTSTQRKTTVKTRVLANNQQLLRVDDEDTFPLSTGEEKQYLIRLESILQNQPIHAMLFQDYNKGVLTPKIIKKSIEWAKEAGIPTIVDPKFHNFWVYTGVTLFKPNLKEIRQQVSFPIQVTTPDLEKATQYIQSRLNNQITLITLSDKGLYLNNAKDIQKLYPTKTQTVADVCGAGDSVISIVTIGFSLGLSLDTIAQLANLAGGQVCGMPGVVSVDPIRLLEEFEADLPSPNPTIPPNN